MTARGGRMGPISRSARLIFSLASLITATYSPKGHVSATATVVGALLLFLLFFFPSFVGGGFRFPPPTIWSPLLDGLGVDLGVGGLTTSPAITLLSPLFLPTTVCHLSPTRCGGGATNTALVGAIASGHLTQPGPLEGEQP